MSNTANMVAFTRDFNYLVTIKDSEPVVATSKVGTILGGWQDGMENTVLDSYVMFWFDTLDELASLKAGDEVVDGIRVQSINDEPSLVVEHYDIVLDKATYL